MQPSFEPPQPALCVLLVLQTYRAIPANLVPVHSGPRHARERTSALLFAAAASSFRLAASASSFFFSCAHADTHYRAHDHAHVHTHAWAAKAAFADAIVSVDSLRVGTTLGRLAAASSTADFFSGHGTDLSHTNL